MPTTSNAYRPNLADYPEFFGLEVFGSFTGATWYENATMCIVWTVTVWRETETGDLFYGVDKNPGGFASHIPFAACTSMHLDTLWWLTRGESFREFKERLNGPWVGQPSMISTRIARNMRTRLQRKVGRYLWREPEC